MRAIRIGTRASALARWQTEEIVRLWRAQEPRLEVEIVDLTTAGDDLPDAPLERMEGTGFFTSTLERALLQRAIDVAVRHGAQASRPVLRDEQPRSLDAAVHRLDVIPFAHQIDHDDVALRLLHMDSGARAQPLGEQASVLVIARNVGEMVLQGVQSGRGKHTGLPHPPAQSLADLPGCRPPRPLETQTRADGASQAL